MEVGRAMTEREKLIQLIKAGHEKASDYFHKEAMAILKQGKSYSSKDRTKTFDEFVADTLIENGIGDISEWKEKYEKEKSKLERYKRALRCACKVSAAIPTKELVNARVDCFLRQAEEEIEEERK